MPDSTELRSHGLKVTLPRLHILEIFQKTPVRHLSAEDVYRLEKTIQTGEAHYWSRSRKTLWHKGATSGLVQTVEEMRIDDDQDAVWLRVRVSGSGASCHVGYRSCFYRRIPIGEREANRALAFTEARKTFDPNLVYGDTPNPTVL